jgi:YD repeat-containing protein
MNRFEFPLGRLFSIALALPALASALNSGPAMPEYNDFEPVDATDMVNLPTGGFTYTIPLMTVPGPGLSFPIVLDYHSGIRPKQEASWVGLGWNLQAGSVTRQVNLFPDDYQGDSVTEQIHAQSVYGWMASIGYNGATVGISWDNTHGYGGMVGYGMSFYGIGRGSATYGWNGVYSGVSVSAGLGVGLTQNVGVNMSVGYSSRTGYNTTAGINAGVGPFSLGGQLTNGQASATVGLSLEVAQVSLSSKGGLAVGAKNFSGSNGISVRGTARSLSNGFDLTIPTSWGVFSFAYGEWDAWIEGYSLNRYYGFLYADKQGMGCRTDIGMDCTGWEAIGTHQPYKKHEINEAHLDFDGYGNANHGRLSATAEDQYMVASQGLSGTFKPFRAEDGDYLNTLTRYQQTEPSDDCGFFSFLGCPDVTSTVNRAQLLEANRNLLNEQGNYNDVYWRFLDDAAGAEYTNPYYARSVGATVGARSKRIAPRFKFGRLAGFEIIKEDGLRYEYTYAVHAFNESKVGADLASSTVYTDQHSKKPYAYAWLLTAILGVDYVSDGDASYCEEYDAGVEYCPPRTGAIGGWVAFSYGNGTSAGGNILTRWRTPYVNEAYLNNTSSHPNYGDFANPNSVRYGPTPYGKVNKEGTVFTTNRSGASGEKEVAYLTKIETPTHVADFQLSDRDDGNNPVFNADDINTPISTEQPYEIPVDSREAYLTPGQVSGFSCGTCTNAGYTVKWYLQDQFMSLPTDLPVGQQVKIKGSYKTWVRLGDPGPDYYAFQTGMNIANLPGSDATVLQGHPHNLIQLNLPAMQYKMESYNVNPFSTEYAPIGVSDLVIEVVNQSQKRLRKLDKIILTNKVMGKEAGAVAFDYDYELTPLTPNSVAAAPNSNSYGGGKLTLKSIRTGSTQKGPWMAPYEFHYQNPQANFQNDVWLPYEKDNTDRWGFRCTTCSDAWHEPNGNDALAWNLERMKLPSGASIEITYEPSRIKYVGKEEYFPVVPGQPTWRKLYLHQTADEAISNTSPLTFSTKSMEKARGAYTQHQYEVQYTVKTVTAKKGSQSCPINNPTGSQTSGDCSDIVLKYPDGTTQAPVQGQSYDYSYAASGFPSAQFVIPTTCWHNATGGSWVRCDWGVVMEKMRLLAKIDAPSNLEGLGGGVRVSTVKQVDIYSNKANTVSYTYEEGATPALPPSFSDYDDGRVPSSMGYELYQGSPGIMYGKVTANFLPANYKSSYYFLTPHQLPVFYGKMFNGNDIPNVTVGNQISVNDLSSLWGQMWKKEDYQGTSAVKVETKRWATNDAWKIGYNELPADQKPFQLADENTKICILVNGEKVIQNYDYSNAAPYVRADNEDQKNAFGLQFNVFGDIYYYGICTDNPTVESCHSQYIRQTRILNRRFLPQLAQDDILQDGLTASTSFYKYDFLNGNALNTWKRNSDGSVLVTSDLPAYAQYPGMIDLNQLTQSYSNTKYFYPPTTPQKALTPGNYDEVVANAVSSTYTAWRPFFEWDGTIHFYRPVGTYEWRNSEPFASITKFAIPNDRCVANPSWDYETRSPTDCPTNSLFSSNWIANERILKYDQFGHPVETEDGNGVPSAQHFGYGQLLPVAIARNARYDQILGESFETPDDLTNLRSPFPVSQSSDYAKSGTKSLVMPGRGVSGGETACMDVGPLPANTWFSASAWYFDDIPRLPAPNAYDPSTYINPGISAGGPGANGAACETAYSPLQGSPSTGFTLLDPNAAPNGSRTWKRLYLKFSCAENISWASICVKNTAGNMRNFITDEWRVSPLNASMTTYAYDERGKMISSTDEREVTTRYEYDAFGNYIRTRNDDGVILSEKAKQYSRR